MLYLPVMGSAAVLLACVAAVATLLAVSKEAESTFPGKNGKIAFVSTRHTKTESGDIYTMNPSGTAVERLTNHPEQDFEPAWSADGSKIAFMSYRHSGGSGSVYRLYTMNARGTSVEPLGSDPHDDHDPAFSPDGSKIAFASYRHGNEDIYTINADGTGLERLTHDPKDDDAPAFSPDGTKIAFTSNRAGNPEIYTMNSDGKRVKRLTNSPEDDLDPAWSPDGNRIAFVRDRHGKKPCRSLFSCDEIYTMNSNGQALERLTNNHAADFNPDWQPLSPPDDWPLKVEGSA